MMQNNLIELIFMVFVLGLKHGIDPDHLVAIDGLTRFNAQNKPRTARWAGFFFSLGHGSVVITFAALLGLMASQLQVPHWTETVGTWVSILVLFLLGTLNLAAVLRAKPGQDYAPIGLRNHFFARLFRVSHPLSIVCVGALFAVSFETLSQATLFTATTTRSGGWLYDASMALIFTVGMMLADASNGFWLSRLIGKANLRAQALSRLMGGMIASLSLTIGAIELIQLVSPTFAARIDEWQLLLSVTIILLSTFGFQVLLYFKTRHQP